MGHRVLGSNLGLTMEFSWGHFSCALMNLINLNFLKVKVEWTEQLVAQQKQRTQQILKETEKQKAVADADRLKAVKAIETAKMIEVLFSSVLSK